MNKIRVYLVDDHQVVRTGLRTLIEHEPDMEVVGEAANGETAAEEVATLHPTVAVMDISMPGMGGAETASRLKEVCSGLRVVVLTVHEERGYLKKLLAAGATGYVLKRSAAETLVRSIRCVAAGETYLDPAVAGQVVAEVAGTRVGTGADLSERETEVLRLVAQGYLIKQIASRLGVEGRTVETYKARAMEKLGLKSRIDVIRYAAQCAWLTGES